MRRQSRKMDGRWIMDEWMDGRTQRWVADLKGSVWFCIFFTYFLHPVLMTPPPWVELPDDRQWNRITLGGFSKYRTPDSTMETLT